jgi:hypothetical protein
VGGRGASFNVPVNRRGSPRSTVGLPGTGLSWSVEHEAGAARGLPNSRRLKPGQLELLKQECLQILHQELFAPDNDAHRRNLQKKRILSIHHGWHTGESR